MREEKLISSQELRDSYEEVEKRARKFEEVLKKIAQLITDYLENDK